MLVGSIHGFVGPTGGSCFSVLLQWNRNEALWRHQQALLALDREHRPEADYARVRDLLLPKIVRTLQEEPFPYILHRTAVRDSRIGDLEVKAGEQVVLSIASATRDQLGDSEILFGGDYEKADRPVHACPGRKMAFGTILGTVTALLRAGTLEPIDRTTIALKAP